MLTLAGLRAKPHTSISQLKTFVACPRKYFFHYIERVTPAFRALALVLGTAWHETIGVYLLGSRDQEPVPEELQAHLRDGIVRGIDADGTPVLFEEAGQDTGAVVDQALKMLAVFLGRVPWPESVVGIEVPFSVDVAQSDTGEILPVPLIGGIDAIVMDAGRTVVLEFKTGRKKWGRDEIEFSPQMTAYKLGARGLGHGEVDLKLVLTTKTKVPDVQIEELVRHPQDERELAEVAFGVHRAVAAGVDFPMRSWACRTCPYAHVCG